MKLESMGDTAAYLLKNCNYIVSVSYDTTGETLEIIATDGPHYLQKEFDTDNLDSIIEEVNRRFENAIEN